MTGLNLVTFVLGTRPEAIKLAPVIKSFQTCKSIQTRVVITGQHREMVSQVMSLFGLSADQDLDIMLPSQTLTYLTCSVLKGLRKEFSEYPPRLVIVQGDTTTAFAGALAAFYAQIPVGHVEAGLRSNDFLDPFPEEGNRRLISQIAHINFAPTPISKANLIADGVSGKVLVTGNTVIDALLLIDKKQAVFDIPGLDLDKRKMILTTVHRRENWGVKLIDIASGLISVLDLNLDTVLLLPLHRNPKVCEPLKKLLGNHPRVILSEPLPYHQLLAAIKGCTLLITDSGGLQEEASAFKKPVLVLRSNTERPEALDSGMAILVGTNPSMIIAETNRLLNDTQAYKAMTKSSNIFGDGKASQRILEASLAFLNL